MLIPLNWMNSLRTENRWSEVPVAPFNLYKSLEKSLCCGNVKKALSADKREKPVEPTNQPTLNPSL